MTEDEAVRVLGGDDADAAARAASALWEMWHGSGSPEIDKILQRGIETMERGDLLAAEALFTDIIRRAPDFAEGWNKRATARYLSGNPAAAVADCEEVLARKPHHFGALSGQGLCHMALGQHKEAADLFRRTLAIYPHLEAARRNLAAALGELIKGNGHSPSPHG
ncbi:MAG TPA: tetratricopeptide repeat protein [Candidatus Acidoferrum sp.]|nr:tetratricopeptide repeat protein [Candidatus Acidoferrum sp.]